MKIQEKRKSMGSFNSTEPRVDGSRTGWSLEGKYYKDPTIFAAELEKIIYPSWIYVGHVSELPSIGDYKLFTLMDESAIIIRGKDNEIRTFYNVCRHRGSVICNEASGNKKRLTCPYHAWTYGLDGTLISARGMPEKFDASDHSLHPCAFEIIDGLIFVNFSDSPPSLSGAKSDLKEPMEMFDFENMKVAAHQRYEFDANWKAALENYQECYHCAPSHPEYALSHTLKVDEDKFDALQEPMMARMKACNVRHFEIDQQFDAKDSDQEQYAYSRYALFENYKTGSRDGEPLAPLLGSLTGFDHGASDISIGPLSYMLAYNDHVVIYVFTPTGHLTSACDIYWLVRGDAVEGEDYDKQKLMWLWHVTTKADERIIVDNMKGIKSQKYRPGPFSKMEFLLERFVQWYLKALY